MAHLKKHNLHLMAILLASLVAFSGVALSGVANAQTTPSPTTFSVIWISDTQYLSEVYPAYYDNLCQWIVNNVDTYNIKMVVHTGDLVNVPTSNVQWTNANHSMSLLLENNVPYCWDAGNHDYESNYWIGSQYSALDPDVMATKPYWVSTCFDGLSTAVHFNVAGWKCLIINLAFNANETALAWANNLLDTYPGAHAIVATHAYIDQYGNYNAWGVNLKNTVLDPHSNVFLTLSGHFHPGTGFRTQVGERHELFFNQQDADAEKGAAAARILTFNLQEKTLTVQTYNVYTGQFNIDVNNQFTLDIASAVPSGLFVLPEYRFAGVSAVAACFAAAGVFLVWKRRLG